MLASIASFQLADGSLSGGAGLSDFRMRAQRVFDVVTPLRQANPVPLDRLLRKFDLTFTVKRVHANIKASEQYVQSHEATVPQSGSVTLISASGATWFLLNGILLSHELTNEIGSTTFHSYHIIGGPLNFGSAAYHIYPHWGTFILTGNSVAIGVSQTMAAARGAFTLTGGNVSFNVTIQIVATTGTFTFTGEPAAISFGNSMSAGFGAFALTGQTATLSTGVGFLLGAAFGSFTLAGESINTDIDTSMAFGSFVLTGEPVTFAGADAILMESSGYILTEGSDHILTE